MEIFRLTVVNSLKVTMAILSLMRCLRMNQCIGIEERRNWSGRRHQDPKQHKCILDALNASDVLVCNAARKGIGVVDAGAHRV